MNRKQRAMKKANRIAQKELKREKRVLLDSLAGCSFSLYGKNKRKNCAKDLKALSVEEKGLRAWRRQILNDTCINSKEVEAV